MKIKAVIFDMDGVVTQTASLHFKAWKCIIEQFLPRINKNNSFTEEDYFYCLDGMPRKEGLTQYFKAIDLSKDLIHILYKNLEECIEDLCQQKNALVIQWLSEQTIECFPDTLKCIEFLLSRGYQIALISSSKNCRLILQKAGISQIFSVYVDGIISEQLKLPGKPHPAIFLEAAKRLNVLPQECLVVEDALAGVKAAKEGGFGKVVALDRKNRLYHEFLKLDPDYILSDLSPDQIMLYHHLTDNRTLESGFRVIPLIWNLLKNQNQLVLFLDYDGTLTPIVETPEKAILSQPMRQCLARLSQNYLTVVMSGRGLENLKKIIDISTIFYAGNHGFECLGPEHDELTYQVGNEYREDIISLYQQLVHLLKNIPGCIIENKNCSLSIHYRLVKNHWHQNICDVLDDVLTDYPNLIRHCGKMVFEIRPHVAWNKGLASEYILNQFKLKNPNLIPIYIGDDVSDEDAFEVFKDKGITIKVMDYIQYTKAHYFLHSPLDVQKFLNYLNGFKDNT